MIYLDREKTKKADIQPDKYGVYQLMGNNTYYVFGDFKIIASNKVVIYAYEYSQIYTTKYDNTKVILHDNSIVFYCDFMFFLLNYLCGIIFFIENKIFKKGGKK